MREPVAGPEKIRADVLAAAQEIARGLLLIGGNVNGGEGARAIEDGELPGIAPIGLNPIAGTTRNERRGDDVAGNVAPDEESLQLEAARPGPRSARWSEDQRSAGGPPACAGRAARRPRSLTWHADRRR